MDTKRPFLDSENTYLESEWDFLITCVLRGTRQPYNPDWKIRKPWIMYPSYQDTANYRETTVQREAAAVLAEDIFTLSPREISKKEKSACIDLIIDVISKTGGFESRKTGGYVARHALNVLARGLKSGNDLGASIVNIYHDVVEDDLNPSLASIKGKEDLTEKLYKQLDSISAVDCPDIERIVDGIKDFLLHQIEKEKRSTKNASEINERSQAGAQDLAEILASSYQTKFDSTNFKKFLLWAERSRKANIALTRRIEETYGEYLTRLAFPKTASGKKPASAIFALEDILHYCRRYNLDDRVIKFLSGDKSSKLEDFDSNQIIANLKRELNLSYEPKTDFISSIGKIKRLYGDRVNIFDVVRYINAKVLDAWDNISSLNSRILSVNPQIIEPNEEDHIKHPLYKRYMGLWDFAGNQREVLQTFYDQHTPKKISFPNKVYTLTKAFMVLSIAKQFLLYNNFDGDEMNGLPNIGALKYAMKQLGERGVEVANSCRKEFESRENCQSWDAYVNEYISAGELGEFTPKRSSPRSSKNSLDGRLNDLVQYVLSHKKNYFAQPPITKNRPAQSYFYLAAICLSFQTLSAPYVFIEGVFPDIDNILRRKRPEVYTLKKESLDAFRGNYSF